jgi:hypothetical protein
MFLHSEPAFPGVWNYSSECDVQAWNEGGEELEERGIGFWGAGMLRMTPQPRNQNYST